MGFFNRKAWAATGVISAMGATLGCLAALPLTYLLNRIVGAPHPPELGAYGWNMIVFSVQGAVLAPALAWAFLRRVPLWRTVVDPAIAAAGASLLSAWLAPNYFFLAVPVAVFLSAMRLHRVYRAPRAEPLPAPAASRLPG